MTLHSDLPIVSGTPYQDGTTDVVLMQNRDGDLVIEATFGNAFSATCIPLTHKAALTLRNQLDAAIHQAGQR